MNAATKLNPDEQPTLTAEEAAERVKLHDSLRLRRSVDHIARAWYGGIAALVATGLCIRNSVEGAGQWTLAAWGAAAGVAWGFAITHALLAVRVGRAEAAKLRRLRELDARAPKAPELF